MCHRSIALTPPAPTHPTSSLLCVRSHLSPSNSVACQKTFLPFPPTSLASPPFFLLHALSSHYPGVPVNSRVSSKIQQLLNTLKRPKRPPLREFFVDDFEELLDGEPGLELHYFSCVKSINHERRVSPFSRCVYVSVCVISILIGDLEQNPAETRLCFCSRQPHQHRGIFYFQPLHQLFVKFWLQVRLEVSL